MPFPPRRPNAALTGHGHKTHEITQVETVLRQLVRKDRVVTMEALLTQRHVPRHGRRGGDYVMSVKEHQLQLQADSVLVFPLPPADDRPETAPAVDVGHRRIARRNIPKSEALGGYSAWPGLAQVFALGHHVRMHKTGAEGVDVVYGVTSLTPERATPGRLLKLACGQGHTVLYHGPYRPERSLSQWAYSLRKNGP